MRPRLLALLLLAAAALLHAGVGLPAATRAQAAAEEYARLRNDSREAQARLATLDQRRQAHARVLAALARTAPPPEQAAARLRGQLASALADHELSEVRLSVRAGRPPSLALARVVAHGSFLEAMALTERLLRETGLVVEQARFGATVTGVDLELALASVGGRP